MCAPEPRPGARNLKIAYVITIGNCIQSVECSRYHVNIMQFIFLSDIYKLSVTFVDVKCTNQSAANIMTTNPRRTYMTLSTYSCIVGHRFEIPDNDTEKLVYCQSNAQWNYTVPPCYRK